MDPLPENFNKIAKEIEKSQESYLQLEEFEKERKKNRKLLSVSVVALVYSIVVAGALLLYFKSGGENLLLFQVSSTDKQIFDINEKLDNVLGRLEKIEAIATSSGENMSNLALRNETQELSKRLSSLEESIKLSPAQALTTTLLNQQQINNESDISDLKSGYKELNDRIFTILISILVVPLLGLLIWIFQKKLFGDS